MGCDIHSFMEYRRRPPHEGIEQWSSFGGELNPGRNYDLFARFAGVRNYSDVTPIDKPRGFPEDAGYEAREEYHLYITDELGENQATLEDARRWVESGCSKYVPNHGGKATWVTDPDAHSESWLTHDEVECALQEYKGPSEPEYTAMLAALRSFEAQGYDSRIVFWFDN
jgi:hypothetical protein